MNMRIERTVKYLAIAITIVVATAIVGTTVSAAPGAPQGNNQPAGMMGGGPRQGGQMLTGIVTDVDDDSITVLDQQDESVVVNIDEDTTLFDIISQSEVVLADVEVDDNVDVRGVRNDDDSVDAEIVTILPNEDSVHGLVEEVNDDEVTLTSRDDVIVVTTDDDTVIYVDGEESELSDVTEGMSIVAYGSLVDDTLDATTLIASAGPGGFEPGVSGEDAARFGPPADDAAPAMPEGERPEFQGAGGGFPGPGANGGRMGNR